MKAYFITDWEKLYEVNSDGGRWRPGQKKRVRPLEYTRWYIFGPAGDNMAFAEVADIAASAEFGECAWPVAWGLFAKLVEVAGRQNPNYRGFLLGRGLSPLSPSSPKPLIRITGFTQKQIKQGFRVLSDPRIGWLQERELPVDNSLSASSANSPALNISHSLKAEAEAEGKEKEEKNETEERLPVLGGEQPPAEAPVPDDSDSGKNNFLRKDSDSDSEKKKGVAKNGEPPPRQVCNPLAVGKVIAVKLGYDPRPLPAKQRSADQTCFETIGELIVAGKLGPPNDAADLCYAQAQRIRGRPETQNPLARFLAWFKKELAKHGNKWATAKEEAEALW